MLCFETVFSSPPSCHPSRNMLVLPEAESVPSISLLVVTIDAMITPNRVMMTEQHNARAELLLLRGPKNRRPK